MIIGKKGQVGAPVRERPTETEQQRSGLLRSGWRKTEPVRTGALFGAGAVTGAAAAGSGIVGRAVMSMSSFSNVFLLIAIGVFLVDLFTDFNFFFGPYFRFIVYAGMGVVAGTLVWEEKSLKMMAYSIILSLAPFSAPYIINGLQLVLPSTIASKDIITGFVILTFSSFWFWAIALKGEGLSRKVAWWIITAILLILVVQIAKAGFSSGTISDTLQKYGSVSGTMEATSNFFTNTIRGVKESPTLLKAEYEKLKNQSIGNYGTEVQKTIGDQLGVQIQSTKATFNVEIRPEQPTPTFFKDKQIIIHVPTIVTTKSDLTLTPFCRQNSTDGTATLAGRNSWTVSASGTTITDQNVITCTFAPDTLNVGDSLPVKIGADYDWNTQSYLPFYVADRTWAQGLQNQGKDPLDFFPDLDKTPKAKTSPGPALLEVTTTPQYLITVSKTSTSQTGVPILSMRLRVADQTTGGYIKNVTSLMIQLPDGFELNTPTCDHTFTSTGTTTDSGLTYNNYQLSEKVENIKGSIDFSCELKDPNAQSLLGNSPPGPIPKTIRASATYIFSAERTVNINVRKPQS